MTIIISKYTYPSALYIIDVFYPSAKFISAYLFPSEINISLLLSLSASASYYILILIDSGRSILK